MSFLIKLFMMNKFDTKFLFKYYSYNIYNKPILKYSSNIQENPNYNKVMDNESNEKLKSSKIIFSKISTFEKKRLEEIRRKMRSFHNLENIISTNSSFTTNSTYINHNYTTSLNFESNQTNKSNNIIEEDNFFIFSNENNDDSNSKNLTKTNNNLQESFSSFNNPDIINSKDIEFISNQKKKLFETEQNKSTVKTFYGSIRTDSLPSPNNLLNYDDKKDLIKNVPNKQINSENLFITNNDYNEKKELNSYSSKKIKSKIDSNINELNIFDEQYFNQNESYTNNSSVKKKDSSIEKVNNERNSNLLNITAEELFNEKKINSNKFNNNEINDLKKSPMNKVETDLNENGVNIFDKQYFNLTDSNDNDTNKSIEEDSNCNIFEKQYFSPSIKDDKIISHQPSTENSNSLKNISTQTQQTQPTQHPYNKKFFLSENNDNLTFRNNQYPDNKLESELDFNEDQSEAYSKVNYSKDSKKISKRDANKYLKLPIDKITKNGEKKKVLFSNTNNPTDKIEKKKDELNNFTHDFKKSSVNLTGEETDTMVKIETLTKRNLKSKNNYIFNAEKPITAFDMAMKIRMQKKEMNDDIDKNSQKEIIMPRFSKWSGKLDSKGYKILEDQVQDLNQLTTLDLVSILKDSILYEDDRILVLDKPYGLASHGGPGIDKSIASLCGPLAERLNKSGRIQTYHIVHRLDRETTGVMVLAKNLETAYVLLSMFKKRQVIKRYWVITKGVPNPVEGIIDIPIAEGVVGNRYRMELRPRYNAKMKLLYNYSQSSNDASEAITNYKVLSSYDSAAIVECQPETGVKHQIRCHLAYGLDTPILGDHKYSHHVKMAPQKLTSDMLDKLGIRQAKVRHLPMHLHARNLVLPEFMDGRNLFVSARLPRHFLQNAKWLKLPIP